MRRFQSGAADLGWFARLLFAVGASKIIWVSERAAQTNFSESKIVSFSPANFPASTATSITPMARDQQRRGGRGSSR